MARNGSKSLLRLAAPIVCLFSLSTIGFAQERQPGPGSYTRPDNIDEGLAAAGKRIYREGILPSGEPVTALVQGDVPVDGTQFTCLACHQRSGWGAIEGNRIVMPVSGPALYQPRKNGYRERPDYTDESLAKVMQDGIDPTGNPLDPLMPLYELGDGDMAALISYLKILSADFSPGVADLNIHFATVITDEVDPSLQKSMLDVLETYFRGKNGKTRHEIRRLEGGPWFRDYKYKAYREWNLHPWYLKGPPETWTEQLEEYYRNQPVFALISGISTRDWQPIHEFCEKHQIPSLLPNTDRPVITVSDHYTLYFSKGLTLEADVIAAHLSRELTRHRVLQVFHEDMPRSVVAASALLQNLAEREDVSVENWLLPAGEKFTGDALAQRQNETGADAIVLWLGPEQIGELEKSPEVLEKLPTIYLSSTLLGADIAAVPEAIGASAFLVHPYTLPRERQNRAVRVKGWLRARKIETVDERAQAQTYFACLMAGEGLMHIKRYFYRDYFVDSIDHSDRMTSYATFYPRLSFGPGQRYLSKGSYIVDLGCKEQASPAEKATWIVP